MRRSQREEDLERELRDHLALEAEEQRDDGLSPEEARYAARRAFGNTALIAEQVREAWGRRWIDDLSQDLRFAVRLLGRNRGFTAGAVIPLAFALGCTACALTLADSILFRPLGMKQPDRIAAVYAFSREKNAFLSSSSYPDFRDVQSLGSLVEAAAALVRVPVNVRLTEVTERMNSEPVTAGAYRVAQRKRDIAVRIAIGAEPRRVIRAFAARGLVVGLAGSAAGLFPAVWASGLLRSSLRGIDVPSPLLFAASGLALSLGAGAAAWVAARRIARIQPAEVLRVQ